MDLHAPPSRFRHRKSPSSDRFLGLSHSAPQNPSPATSYAGDELDEDDVFWTGDFAESSHQSNISSASAPRQSHRHNPILQYPRVFSKPETFGILAALPEDDSSQSSSGNSLFYHKSSISTSPASSSSRMIPIIPKSPKERIALPSSVTYHQSAPVNVPMMARRTRRPHDFDEVDAEDDDDQSDGEMLPPHEMVARSSAHSPMLSCSVLEGAGRTLKGRDLRQVRNAVLRRTGVFCNTRVTREKIKKRV